MEKITRENIETHLFDYMLEVIGKTRIEILDAYNWRAEFTISRVKYTEFYEYSIKLIMKTLHISKNKAIVAFERFWKQYGVRLKG